MKIDENRKAREDEYFYEEHNRQLAKLKEKLKQNKEKEVENIKEDLQKMKAKLEDQQNELNNINKL